MSESEQSEKSAAEIYLEKSRASGLMTEENEAEFLAVAEMLRHPYSLEQAKAQIARAEKRRALQRGKKD